MRRTRKRLKENNLSEERENKHVERYPKRLRGNEHVDAEEVGKSKQEIQSKYFRNCEETQQLPVQCEVFQPKKERNSKIKKANVTAQTDVKDTDTCVKVTDTGVKDTVIGVKGTDTNVKSGKNTNKCAKGTDTNAKGGKNTNKCAKGTDTNVKGGKNTNTCAKVTDTCVKDNTTGVKDSAEENTDRFTKDLLTFGLQRSNTDYKINVFQPTAARSRNMMHHLEQLAMGMRSRLSLKKSVQSPLVDLYSDFEVYRVASPFDRRVTALEWHPTRPNILAVGSKGGDIILWDVENFGKEKQIDGKGAAGSCQTMKFWPWDLNKIVSASINGTVTLHDFNLMHNQTLADTMDSYYDHWYCSLDVNHSRNMVVAGRNHGLLHIMSQEGRMIFEQRLHTNKITHVEFSPREEWLLCTASTDKTVKLWDIRQMKDRKSTLQILKHEKPVNSAYFSQTDGCRLLTTDQGTEIRVYQTPSWHLETTISHPHRFFQHITPFKATWHPLQDLIVCGRYPDVNFPGFTPKEGRSIDLFEADTGKLVSQLSDPSASGLCCLNKFNRQGDALATGMGLHTILWNRKEVREVKQKKLSDLFNKDYSYLNTHSTNRNGRGARQGQGTRQGLGARQGQGARRGHQGRRDDEDTDSLKRDLADRNGQGARQGQQGRRIMKIDKR